MVVAMETAVTEVVKAEVVAQGVRVVESVVARVEKVGGGAGGGGSDGGDVGILEEATAAAVMQGAEMEDVAL